MTEQRHYFCSVLISGKIIMYAQDINQAKAWPTATIAEPNWLRPCEVAFVPIDDENYGLALKRLDVMNKDESIPAPDASQILSTYVPNDTMIAKYQDVVEEQGQAEGGIQ